MRHLAPLLLIVLLYGCSSSLDSEPDVPSTTILGIRERIIQKRTKFLAEAQYLPGNTPYDAQPEMRELYLRVYSDTYLRACHPDTAQGIPVEVYPIFQTNEDRVEHYAWLAGKNAGWDQMMVWHEEAAAEAESEILNLYEPTERSDAEQ